MALINKAKREINAKIVYFGHEGNGKGASLAYIYDRLKPALRGEFKTMQSMGNALNFFDFTPFEIPMFGGYTLKFHVYTIVGRVSNPAAWKMTLKGADGIVLTCNADPALLVTEQESIAHLRDFVGSYGLSLHDIPLVAQIGKALPEDNCSAADVCCSLGIPGVPAVLAVPKSGEGVLESFSMLSQMVMEKIGKEKGLADADRGGVAPAEDCEAVMQPVAAPELLIDEQAAPASDVSVAVDDLAVCRSGDCIQIPLKISAGGVERRLVVTVSVREVSDESDIRY